jgi:hypothetical protein
MTRTLAASLAALVALTTLLAVAGTAQAAPAPPQPACARTGIRSVDAACNTLLWALDAAIGPVDCLLNTAPVNWAQCTTGSAGPIPIVDYLLCYYYTPPANWVAACV